MSMFMAHDKEDNVKTYAWYIDWSESPHFTNMRDWYINYVANEYANDHVLFGGGEEYKVEGKGSVQR